MILAGVLLKLGGVGLIRIKGLLDLGFLENFYSYFMLSYLVASVLCYYQTDFKKVIAYSRVFHIRLIPVLVLVNTPLADSRLVILMFMHGVISPLLFFLVGARYEIVGRRQTMLIRGIFLGAPTLSFMAAMTFVATLPAPPFTSFVGEVFIMLALSQTFVYVLGVLGLGIFMSLVYNFN